MLEPELFALLEHTADAAYVVTPSGEICSWNRSAERLFGYRANEVLGRHVEAIFDAYDALGTEPLVGGAETAVRSPNPRRGIPNFDLDVRTRSGARLWINVSTIVYDNRRTGRRLLVQLARDIGPSRVEATRLDRALDIARQLVALEEHPPRDAAATALTDRERRILGLFAGGTSSASIARRLGISAQTLRNQLHRINRKLGTRTRLEAVTHAQRRGLIK